MIKYFVTSLLFILSCYCLIYPQEEKIKYVNPFIGTANSGNTFPGAAVPWGMISVSPHNSLGSPSGYVYGGKYFYGFGLNHLSGTGCPDLGSVVITATKGKIECDPEKYKSTYSDEKASPGYYRLKLNDTGIAAEVTAAERCGIIKLTSNNDSEINILIDAGKSLNLTGGGKVKISSDSEIEGCNISGGFCGELNRQTLYFVIRFNQSSLKNGNWKNDALINLKQAEVKDTSIGSWFTFNLKKEKPLLIKTGISYVSIENARMNLDREIPGWDFDLVKRKGQKKWEEVLSRIGIDDSSDINKKKFYTALYHMLIHPNIINDVNGEYPLMGRNGIGKYENRNRYSVFSLWDTYRTLHPFLTLVYPEKQSEIIKSMIDMYKESGYLPKWELAGNETYMMVGDPAPIVITDSYIKGIRDFDVNAAFEAMLKPVLLDTGEYAPPIRAGYHQMLHHKYIPFEQNLNEEWWVWGPASTTLEYCLSDWAIAQFAKKLGRQNYYETFIDRSAYYKNLFDESVKFIRPKLKNGNWFEPFNPLETEGSGDWSGSGGPGYVEGNAWNYTWFVPHDIKGLINLFGGQKPFLEKLIECFNNGTFTINNEPDIAYPYLFNYLRGKEFNTREFVEKIMDEEFGTDANGLPGNDDCGTISGWFVFSALGLYPACPASDFYETGIPLFNKVTVHLQENYYEGKTIVIEKAINKEKNEKFKIEFNSTAIENYKVNHNELTSGGKLVFYLK